MNSYGFWTALTQYEFIWLSGPGNKSKMGAVSYQTPKMKHEEDEETVGFIWVFAHFEMKMCIFPQQKVYKQAEGVKKVKWKERKYVFYIGFCTLC